MLAAHGAVWGGLWRDCDVAIGATLLPRLLFASQFVSAWLLHRVMTIN